MLQGDTESQLYKLTVMKRYLTYVSIKLPVLDLVISHQQLAMDSDKFKDKEVMLARADLTVLPAFAALNLGNIPALDPKAVVAEIRTDSPRLKDLFGEDQKEIEVLSQELSLVLEGSLLAETLDVDVRSLDIRSASLEIDRTAKNRSNALKTLSVVMTTTLGITVAKELNHGGNEAIIAGLVTFIAAWFGIDWLIELRSKQLKILVPFETEIDPAGFEKWIKGRNHAESPHRSVRWLKQLANWLTGRVELKRQHGSRVSRTWTQWLKTSPSKDGHVGHINEHHRACRVNRHCRRFAVAVDYDVAGYLYAVTLECEFSRSRLHVREIVSHLFAEMDLAGAFPKRSDTRSVLAETLSHLGEPIDGELPG